MLPCLLCGLLMPFLAIMPVSAGNIALWHETGSAWQGDSGDRWAAFPPRIARRLTFHLRVDTPTDSLDQRLRDTVHNAIAAWETVVDVDFVEVARAADALIRFEVAHDGSENHHYHGGGDAKAPVRAADASFAQSQVQLFYGGYPDPVSHWREDSWVWVAAHEIGHALGLWHEFERPDRDQFIRTSPDPSFLDRLAPERGDPAGTPFDSASIMCYAWNDKDRNPAYFLMQPDGVTPITSVNFYQRNEFSPGDIKTARILYGRAPSAVPLQHRSIARSRRLPERLAADGWVVRDAADPGMVSFADGALVVIQERGTADHWLAGGNPPRLERPLPAGDFQLSVDLEARYVPPGSHAGIFIMRDDTDWIYFGPFEHPMRIRAQRTGGRLIPPYSVGMNRYTLQARLRGETLELGVVDARGRTIVATFTDFPRPRAVGLGVKSWGGAARSFRSVRFRNFK